jgi:glycosyltransferase involved in cell wall biosynthesis
MQKISTIVITFNEAANIERCLASVRSFSDEIVVVDSFSTDATADIARGYTSHVFQHAWLGYSGQKKFALAQTAHPWVFWIDADEEVSAELQNEITAATFDCDGYQLPRTTRYLDRWILHGTWYPEYVVRLFRKDKGAFTDAKVHERFALQGTIGRLHSPLRHYSYRDISHHVSKMNAFTTLAAGEMAGRGKHASGPDLWLRPLFHFVKGYVFKQGYRDGMAGLIVALLDCYYVFLKYAKLREMPASHDVKEAI